MNEIKKANKIISNIFNKQIIQKLFGLMEEEDYDGILKIIDKFSKLKHYAYDNLYVVFCIACDYGHLDLVKYMYNNTEISIHFKNELVYCIDPLYSACEYEQTKIVKFLLEETFYLEDVLNLSDYDFATNPLYFAAINNNLDMLKILIKNGFPFWIFDYSFLNFELEIKKYLTSEAAIDYYKCLYTKSGKTELTEKEIINFLIRKNQYIDYFLKEFRLKTKALYLSQIKTKE